MGTSPDIAARVLAPVIGKHLGMSLLVENKPGAGGNLGAEVCNARLPQQRCYG
jgi:tripartite-type tricarboxylate transporter receptor subunit TctC